MGKIKKALIKLSKKVTGKDLTNEDSIGDVVNFMADNYSGGGEIPHVYMLTFRLYEYYFHMFTKTPSGLNGKFLNDENDLQTIALTSEEQRALFNSLLDLIATSDDLSRETLTHYIKPSFAITSAYFKNHSEIAIDISSDEEEGERITSTVVNINFYDDDDGDAGYNFTLQFSRLNQNPLEFDLFVGSSYSAPIKILETQIF